MASSSSQIVNGAGHDRPVGIITKTVLRSPVTRWLLQAKLRSNNVQDLVFVGQDFIHVKQVGAGGHLIHIATKADFDTPIRAAKVFSIDTEPLDEDLLIKPERSNSANGTKPTPSEFLVLTLETNDLLFLYLTTDGDGRPRFIHQPCPMPRFDCVLYSPGEHLAIDPHSRALAVAANEREVIIYSAKTAARLRHELSTGDPDWTPISSQRPLQVNGVIQHMEFLIPASDDEDHIILLLIVIDQRKTKALWIDWYYSSDLHHAQVHSGQSIDTARTVSSFLIPLRDAAFMIVTGSQVTLWRNLLSGSATGSELCPLEAEPKNSGNSPRQPVWASWCRPHRSRAARQDIDHIYLVREDGLVFLVHARTDSLDASSAGHFQCHVGSAFASLGGTGGPDILAVAGDMSTGRVVSIGQFPRHRVSDLSWSDTMEMALIETIPNWASATDLITVTPRHPQVQGIRSIHSSASIIVTSGRDPYGSVTELRYGLEARIAVYFSLDDLESVTGVWAIPMVTTGSVLMFLTNPSATRLLVYPMENIDDTPAELDASECTALETTETTLVAAVIADGRIVQVTPRSIAVTVGLNTHFEDSTKRVCEGNDQIIAAAIAVGQSVIVTAERKAEHHFLCSTRLSDRDTIIARAELNYVPTSIAAVSLGSGVLVALGSTTGYLMLYGANDSAVQELCRATLPSSHESPGICDYVALLQSADSNDVLVVCGLRDGRLHAVRFVMDDSHTFQYSDENTVGFGHTAVKVLQLPNTRTQACALSGADTCSLSWTGGDASTLDIRSIWLSDKGQPELAQGPVVACSQMPSSDFLASPEFAGALVLISGNDVFVSRLDAKPSTVPRQIPVSGTPSRLLYTEQQRCFVVASTRTAIRSFPTPASRPEERRQVWPAIDFIPARSSEPSFTHDLQPGERVFALLEWSYRLDETKSYSYILVGGSYIRSNGSPGGRITFLQPTNRKWEVVGVKVGTEKKFEAPVYALALYDEHTYVVCYGRLVMLYRFSLNERKWKEVCVPFQLASEGIFISVTGPLIYISTRVDSLVTLRLRMPKAAGNDGHEATRLAELIPVSMGPQAHNSLSHLVVQPNTPQALALLATKDGQLVGLTSPNHISDSSTPRHAANILFEAGLPRSLTRLRQSNVRPKWKTDAPTGVLADNIVGTSADGTLVGIALLDEPLWRRLSWLQRLCEWSEDLSPHSCGSSPKPTENGYSRDQRALPIGLANTSDDVGSIMLGVEHGKALDMHINGDVLGRLLDHNAADTLRDVIEQAATQDDRVGEWMREHLASELAAVEDIIQTLTRLLDRWI